MSGQSSEQTIDAVTLFEREDGTRSMKYGRHGDKFHLNTDTGGLQKETAEVVELGEEKDVSEFEDASDFPERVREFFGVVVDDD